MFRRLLGVHPIFSRCQSVIARAGLRFAQTIKPFFVACRSRFSAHESVDEVEKASRMLQRFTISDSTVLRYLDDFSCSEESLLKGVTSVNTSRPWPDMVDPPPAKGLFEAWDQHLPFSAYPVTTYDPELTVDDAYGAPLARRVYVPQPFAHTLQVYESFDHNEDRKISSSILTPTTTNTSFTTYLSQSSQCDASTLASSSETLTGCSERIMGTKKEKKYYLLHQYTRKGKGSFPVPAEPLIPMGSSFDTAFKVFCTFFKRKTGVSWEEAKQGSVSVAICESNTQDVNNESKGLTRTQSPNSGSSTEVSDRAGVAVNATGTLGASFFKSSPQTTEEQSKPFRYVPNAAEDLQEISNAYAERYREKWLPSHAQTQPCIVSRDPSIAEDARTWAEVAATTKND